MSTLKKHQRQKWYTDASEDSNIVRVGYQLLQQNEIEDSINEKSRAITKKFSTKEQNLKLMKYSNRKIHNYFYNKLQRNSYTDTNIIN